MFSERNTPNEPPCAAGLRQLPSDPFASLVRRRWWMLVATLALIAGAGVIGRSVFAPARPTAAARTGPMPVGAVRPRDTLMVHLERDGAPLPTAILQTAHAVADAAPGVERVWSIVDLQDVRLVDGKLKPFPLLDVGAARAAQSPLARGLLLSADGSQAVLWVQLAATPDNAHRDAALQGLQTALGAALAGLTLRYSGAAVIEAAVTETCRTDFLRFAIFGGALIAGVLWLLFGRLRIALAVAVVLGGSLVVVLGSMALVGQRLGVLLTQLPILVFALALADIVHLPAAHARLSGTDPSAAPGVRVARTLRAVWAPCLLTTLTSIAGLLALTSSPVAALGKLGVFAAIGVGVALLFSMVLMAVALHSTAPALRPSWSRGIGWCLARGHAVLIAHPRRVMAALAVVTGLAALPVTADLDLLDSLPTAHPARTDLDHITAEFGPHRPIALRYRATQGLRADHPRVLRALERFEAAVLASRPGLISAGGPHTLWRRTIEVVRPVAEAEAKTTPELVATMALSGALRRAAQTPELEPVERLIDPDRRGGRLVFLGPPASSRALIAERDAILAHARSVADVVRITTPDGASRLTTAAHSTQLRGTLVALGVLFLILLAWLRDLRLALIGMLPNLFAIAALRAGMALTGASLDLSTAVLNAIVLGVSIDDTIHFLHHWRQAEAAGTPWADAVRSTFERAGPAVVTTTALLLVAYCVPTVLGTPNISTLGLLLMIAALAALVGDLVLLPLVLRAWPGRTKNRRAALRVSRPDITSMVETSDSMEIDHEGPHLPAVSRRPVHPRLR